VNASLLPGAAADAAAATSGATAGTPTGGGSATTESAYELTGPNERQVEEYVGRRVEVTGKLKPAEIGAAGPTGGPTAGAPPRGVDVLSKDLRLRELEVSTVRPTTGICPAL
jgi:hypothetical protein